MLAVLYDVDVRTINEHIGHIYQDSELTEAATIRKFRIVQKEGARDVSREVNHSPINILMNSWNGYENPDQ